MFTTYQYQAGSTVSNILDDITLLLTGKGTDLVVDGTMDNIAVDWDVSGGAWADGTTKAQKNADGVDTLTAAVPLVAVAGRTYLVTFEVLDWSVAGVTVTFGGTAGTLRSADGTFAQEIVASTTGELIFTPSAANARFSIDNVLIQPMTGITDKTLLSGDYVAGSTEILSTTLADWEVYDDATGTAEQTVFRALNADGSTYKYMMVDMAAAGYINIQVGESWDTSGNTWTNICYHCDIDLRESQVIDVSAGGTIFLGAASTYAIFWSKNAAGTEYGSTTPGWGPCGCFERTRTNGWDTVGTGYPPFFYANMNNIALSAGSGTGYYNAFTPRFKGQSGDVTGIDAHMNPVHEFSNTEGSSFRVQTPSVRCWDTDGVSRKHYMHEVGFISVDEGTKFGKMLDIYFTTTGYGSAEDTVSYLGNTYFLMTEFVAGGTGAGARIAVPKY